MLLSNGNHYPAIKTKIIQVQMAVRQERTVHGSPCPIANMRMNTTPTSTRVWVTRLHLHV